MSAAIIYNYLPTNRKEVMVSVTLIVIESCLASLFATLEGCAHGH